MWIDDVIVKRCSEPMALDIWVPDQLLVVLGSSNRPEREVHEKNCAADGVPVLRRYGGGGCVILYQGCVVVSVGAWMQEPFANQKYFQLLNGAVIQALCRVDAGLNKLEQRGISDIAWQGRKVAGTSMFRSRQYLLYQASIIVSKDAGLFGRYLQHPSKEPDYRQGRGHDDFLMGLDELIPGMTALTVAAGLQAELFASLEESLLGEMIDPQPDQWPALFKRMARSSVAIL
jgi:lipoate---protein ligase